MTERTRAAKPNGAHVAVPGLDPHAPYASRLSARSAFGLARGTIRKTSVRPALYGAPVRLLVRALRLAGVLPLDLVQARAFKLLGLDPTEVIEALGEMNRMGALRFRMQGDVVELDVRGA